MSDLISQADINLAFRTLENAGHIMTDELPFETLPDEEDEPTHGRIALLDYSSSKEPDNRG
jgi:hypothetical protein